MLAVSVDKESLLHLVQNLEFQVLWRFGLQQLQAESVDRPDEHFGHARNLAERLAGSRVTIRSFSSAAALSVNVKATMLRGSKRVGPSGREQMDDPPCHDLGLARTRAGNQLEIPAAMLNGAPLRLS